MCYVFVTGGEFDRYRRLGIDTRYLGGRQGVCEVAWSGGTNRIRYKVLRDVDGQVVVIDGTENSLRSKATTRMHLHSKADAGDISEHLSPYLRDVRSVINECAPSKDSAEVTLFTHWGGGMPQDVSAIERIVQESLAEYFASQYEEWKWWKAYSISSVRPEVFDISRGEIPIPDLKECAEIERRAEAYGGVRDWLNALALVCSSTEPVAMIESLPNPPQNPDGIRRIIGRLGMFAELKKVSEFLHQLAEEGLKAKKDRLAELVTKEGADSFDGNCSLRERSAECLARLINGEV